MKKVAYIIIISVLIILAFGYNKLKYQSNNKEIKIESVTKAKKIPGKIERFDTLVGQRWISIGQSNSKDLVDFSKSEEWKAMKGSYSVEILNEKTLLFGNYVNNQLLYGRVYKVDMKDKEFHLTATQLVASQKFIDKKYPNQINDFSKLNEVTNFNEFSKINHVNQLFIIDINKIETDKKFDEIITKIYLPDKETLIRESKREDSKVTDFMKYEVMKK